MRLVFVHTTLTVVFIAFAASDDNDGVQEPSLCEVCKFFALELQTRLDETGKSRDVIETGHGLDTNKKKKKYHISELRLIEVLHNPHVCDKILEYNVHKERKGSNRFAKGRSQTLDALHGLVDKGVKVDLGMPYEMWDQPSAEVSQMQRKCYNLVEEYEEDIENWYFKHQDKNFLNYLCRNIVLKSANNACLDETHVPELSNKDEKQQITSKGDRGNRDGSPPKSEL